MNGELVQTVNITLFLRHYLRTGEFAPTPHEERRYASASFRRDGPEQVFPSLGEWMRHMKHARALEAAYLALSIPADPNLTAFANAVPMGVVTVCPDRVSLWTASFSRDEKAGDWLAEYREAPCDPGLPRALLPGDPEAGFLATLRDIAALGYRLDGGAHFSDHYFRKAIDCLEDRAAPVRSNFVLHGTLPRRSRRLLAAVTHAWVFGTMGSWSDLWTTDPGLSRDYSRLSSALARDINRVILFAVNAS